jgi:Phage integrase family
MQSVLYDAAGHRRSPVTMPGFHEGRAPRNKGRRYPADPPTVEEIIAVMREAGSRADGVRLRALIVILWRAGLRIGEALDLAETDLDAARGAVLVRRGKGGRRREVGMDRWAWSQLEPWLAIRGQLLVGALLCVIRGATAGRHWEPSAARTPAGAHGSEGGRATTVCTPSAAPRPRCSRWRTKVHPWLSSSASSGTPTLGSPRSTCRESTAPRSLTQFTPGQHQ